MRKNPSLKVSQFSIICFIGCLLFFRPADYVIGGTLYRLTRMASYFYFILIAICSIYSKKKGYRISNVSKMILMLYFWCLLGSTLINYIKGNPADFFSGFSSFILMASFVLLCDFGFWLRPKTTLRIFLMVGMVICTINALTFFIYFGHGGMYHGNRIQYGRLLSENYFFLAEDNASYFWSWPVLVVAWIYYFKYSKSKLYLWAVIGYNAIIFAAYLYVWSVMAAIACFLVPLVMLALIRGLTREKRSKKTGKHREIQFWYMWVGGLIFNVMITTQSLISSLLPIIQMTNKSDTLSGRTYIWLKSYYYIFMSPIVGYGYEPMETSVSKLNINHTHNLVLETLYRGGAIGFVLLVLLFLVMNSKCRKVKNSILYKYLYIMIFIFLILSSLYFAFYRYHYLILFVLMAHSELFSQNERKWTK